MSYLKILLCVVFYIFVSGCATVKDNPSQTPVQQEPVLQAPATAIMLTKKMDQMNIVLLLESDVATKTPLGIEIYDTFRKQGWRQLTFSDRSNNDIVHVIRRLGVAVGDTGKVIIACQDQRAIEVNGEILDMPLTSNAPMFFDGLSIQIGDDFARELVRKAVVDLVLLQKSEAIRIARDFISSKQAK